MKFMVADIIFRATRAWCDDNKICILLSDQKEIRFPVELNTKLKNATFNQLNNIEIICNGTGLHWPDLDEDLSVTGIVEGRYSSL